MSIYDGDNINYVMEAIDSIINQTYQFIEFIIVLDGVKRNDLNEIIKLYIKKDERIKIRELKRNMGLAFCLNEGIKMAKGEYIIRMDADDISKVNRVEKLVKFMESNPEIDIAGSFIEEFEDNLKDTRLIKYPEKNEDMKKLFFRRNPLAHASVIFRKSFFEKAGLYPLISIRNEDTLLWLSGFKYGCKFSNIPEALYLVRFYKDNYFRRSGLKKSLSDFVDRLRIIIDLNGSFYDLLYALATLVVQNMPYCLYNYIRKKFISCR
jgi:glycosyltransferase involved in cell wall biosynthesis